MKGSKIMTTIIATAVAASIAQAQEAATTANDQSNLNVTIYNSNLALIKDTRNVGLAKGQNVLAFKDVSASIQPESAILKADNVTLLEQNFEYDLLSEQALLNKYVGQTVTVETTNPATGEMIQQEATVLANNNGVMLKIGNQIRSLGKHMSVIYNHVPDNLRDKPTLTMTVDNQGAEKQQIELSYLSHNLGWKADYVANLVDDKTLNLKGWVTLTNNSGTTYNNANLQLVAGDVNRVQPQYGVKVSRNEMMMKVAAAPVADMAEESLFEYHLYTLGFPTTIKDKQQKQVSLLEAANVPYEKRLLVSATDPYGWQSWGNNAEYVDLSVNAKLILDNKKANQLGMPMPAGVIRTYQNDSKGNMQFIGEDSIKHTPENETITLQMGESFDVTVKRKQMNFNQQRVAQKNAVQNTENNVLTATYEVLFKNAKDKEAIVDYQDTFFSNWEIVEQSLNSNKLNSELNLWKVAVPAKGETTLTYTVKITY